MLTAHELIARSEARRSASLLALPPAAQVKFGQFFTNDAAARLIASFPRLPKSGTIRVLDPGAGSGALSAAVVARIITEAPELAIELTAVEIDSNVLLPLRETLADCADAAKTAGVNFSSKVVLGSYIDAGINFGPSFDLVILNPPYAKLAAGAADRVRVAAHVVDSANIYAAFVALAVSNLVSGAQLVAITPRSFTNGTYFTNFRKWLLKESSIDRIHIFGSRSSVFADTGVLQENIVYSLTRRGTPNDVVISTSTDHRDAIVERTVAYTEIVHIGDSHEYIRIPSTDVSSTLVEQFNELPCTLADLGVRVSTGRVVDFRSRDQLIDPPLADNYPMVYAANISHGILTHPRAMTKAQRYSIINPDDSRWLVPAGKYVLIKRFSAKEEKRRLVAGIWDSALYGGAPVAIDNKLNYIHADGEGLDESLAWGLAIWFNSAPVDDYFRTFSGHTQVNATDLRGMRYPTAKFLRSIGEGLTALPDQTEINRLVGTAIEVMVAA